MLLSSFDTGLIEAGCDEAGRGCLAGSVFAAAVILPKNYQHQLLNDSKKLNKKTRELLRLDIEKDALAFAVASCSPEEIDHINILNASFLAMHRAIGQLAIVPQLLLIDGNRFKPYADIPHHCMIKGDGRFLSIAAASILAKTYRDDLMLQLHNEYPDYGWDRNKGYPTREHKLAIQKHGLTLHHRKTFRSEIQLRLNL